MKILAIIFIFFILNALLIISNNELSLIEDKNIKKFSELYVQWLNKIYENSQKITGNMVKLDWIPE